MAWTLLVWPRETVRFIWGRVERATSWLNIKLSQHTTVRSLSIAGQGAAALTLISVFTLDARGIDAALASNASAQTQMMEASMAGFDFTTLFIGFAILLLATANYAMWRQRKDALHHDRSPSEEDIDAPLNPSVAEVASNIDNFISSPIDLERQCQKLALIADRSQRDQLGAELNNRVREEALARICHDLRTPLNAVIGFSDLMRQEMFGPLGHDKYVEYAEHIGDSGHNLLSAVDDIFEMTAEHDLTSSDLGNSTAVTAGQILPADDNDLRVLEAAK